MPTLDLGPVHLERVQTLLREHAPWAEVWAYGSRVNGDSQEASDLDLVLRDPQNLSTPCSRLPELQTLFAESELPILIDIVDWARIPEHFRKEIEKAHFIVQPVP